MRQRLWRQSLLPKQNLVSFSSDCRSGHFQDACFFYPLFYTWSQHLINAHQFGIYVGSSVHEVAQVYAIGENIDPIVANTVSHFKMIRVMMLAPFY